MKKGIAIALAIVVLAILVIIVRGFFVSELPAQPPANSNVFGTNAPSSAEERIKYVVANCYTWYVKEFMEGIPPAAETEHANESLFCFTQNFIQQWSLVSDGGDPVILAQDYFPSWTDPVQTEVRSITETESEVFVGLGRGNELHVILVRLTMENGTWKIRSAQLP